MQVGRVSVCVNKIGIYCNTSVASFFLLSFFLNILCRLASSHVHLIYFKKMPKGQQRQLAEF